MCCALFCCITWLVLAIVGWEECLSSRFSQGRCLHVLAISCLLPQQVSLWPQTSTMCLVSPYDFFLIVSWFYSKDSSPFIFRHEHQIIYFLLCGDDIVVTGSNDQLDHSFIVALGRGFVIKDLGPVYYFLELQVATCSKGIHVHQLKYAHDLMLKHDLLHSQPMSTLMSTKSILTATYLLENPSLFREFVGFLLQYLTITGPFFESASHPHLFPVKGTLDRGFVVWPSTSTCSLLSAYSDDDWAGCIQNSTILCLMQVLKPLNWDFLYELGSQLHFPVFLHCDNLNATYMATNPVFHAQTKHIESDYHFIKEKVSLGSLCVRFIPFTDQPADLLTKPLHESRHCLLSDELVHPLRPSLRGYIRHTQFSPTIKLVDSSHLNWSTVLI